MSTPDEELVQGWKLVRCSDCRGFSMAKKPAPAKAAPAAVQPRVLPARREEISAEPRARDIPSGSESHSTTQAPITAPADSSTAAVAAEPARTPAKPPVPPVFIYGDRAPRTRIPEPLPELEYVAPARAGRFAAPVALMALGALVVFAGVQVRETHLNRLAATAAMNAAKTVGPGTPKITATPTGTGLPPDSISIGQSAAVRTKPETPADAIQRPASGAQK